MVQGRAFEPVLDDVSHSSRSVVVAPDKFKGSLTAEQVAEAIAAGLVRNGASLQITRHPVADGGDGLVTGLVRHGFRKEVATVAGPLGKSVQAAYATRGEIAVVELATASGMDLLARSELDPFRCSTYGTGQLIREAVARGARHVVVGVGGSATCDGGAGILAALGARFLDHEGRMLPPGPEALTAVADVDLSLVPGALRGAKVVVASDVRNVLLGKDGAVAIFGPQKGARPDQLPALEERMGRWADALERCVGRRVRERPGTGAAGGSSFALAAVFDAPIQAGIDLFLDLSRFDEVVKGADLVITGEGCFDEQTLAGKAPLGVCRAASRRGVPTAVVAGTSTLTLDQARRKGFASLYTLSTVEPDRERSICDAAPLISTVSARLARDMLCGN